jgi:hypothetical protein
VKEIRAAGLAAGAGAASADGPDIASLLGLGLQGDAATLNAQAAHMWTMLDDLSQNDPEVCACLDSRAARASPIRVLSCSHRGLLANVAECHRATRPQGYKRFLEEQLAAAKEEREGAKKKKMLQVKAGMCVRARVTRVRPQQQLQKQTVSSSSAADRPRRPSPADLSPGATVFVNVCVHESVQTPRDHSPEGKGRPVADVERELGAPLPLAHLFNLEIPIVLGEFRPFVDGEAIELFVHSFVCSFVRCVTPRPVTSQGGSA